jgi:aminoglycoside phosphotransferase (APT) family kinase protein
VTNLDARELAAISAYLATAGVPVAGRLESQLIAGGRSNLTFRLKDECSSWVLRMPPRTGRTPSAHDVAREFRVTAALQGTGVPVPAAVALCEDESVIGGPFAVSDYVKGTTVQSRTDLDALDETTIAVITTRLVEALAAIHDVDYISVGLESFGRPDGYSARQIRRWTGQWEIVGAPALADQAAELSRRLASAVPVQRCTSVVHGDFRIDNTLLRLHEQPTVAAVVDWELSTIGDPVADVAMMCAYRAPTFDLIMGAPSAWTSDRLPQVSELAAMYETAGGVPLNDWSFHLALAYFKVAVIAAGIDHRYRQGAGVGAGFDSAGDSVGTYLDLGLDALR